MLSSFIICRANTDHFKHKNRYNIARISKGFTEFSLKRKSVNKEQGNQTDDVNIIEVLILVQVYFEPLKSFEMKLDKDQTENADQSKEDNYTDSSNQIIKRIPKNRFERVKLSIGVR